MKTTYHRIGAAKTTLLLIEYLVDQESPVSAKSVADYLDISESNAKSYLVTLEDAGYAKQTNSGWMAGMSISIVRMKFKQRLLSKRARLSRVIESIEAQEAEEAKL